MSRELSMKFINVADDIYARICSPHRRDILYGRSHIIRSLCNYKRPRPIRAFFEHGVDAIEVDLVEKNLDDQVPFIVYNKYKYQNLKSAGKKNIIKIPDPFTYTVIEAFSEYDFYYRFESNKDNRKRMLYFYGHSTPDTVDLQPFNVYVALLLELRDHYDDFTVCLHYSDVAKGIGDKLQEMGIHWVSLPMLPRAKFSRNFYKLVSHYNHFSSNVPGSYLYYITALNLPFVVYDLKPQLKNISDYAQTSDYYDTVNERFPHSTAYQMFAPDSGVPMEEKRAFALNMLGHDSPILAANIINLISHRLGSYK